MKTLKTAALILAAATLGQMASGCRSPKEAAAESSMSATIDAPVSMVGPNVQAMPSAIVYRTSADYADKVPVTLSPDGGKVVNYPAPTDLSANSTPILLGDGYLLDRRGIGRYTVFTTYTYDEYRRLKQAPTPDELLAAVIPGSGVTEIISLPVTASQAWADPESCRRFIADGFKGCKVVYRARTLKAD